MWSVCSGVLRQVFVDGIHYSPSDGGKYPTWSQFVIIGKPLARVSLIGKEFSMSEGVLRCYLNHTILDLA